MCSQTIPNQLSKHNVTPRGDLSLDLEMVVVSSKDVYWGADWCSRGPGQARSEHFLATLTLAVSDWMGAEPNNDKASRSRYQQERRGNALVFE